MVPPLFSSGISPEAKGSGDPLCLIKLSIRSSLSILNFLILEIYFLLLSDNSKEKGWNCFIHGDYVEDEGDSYGVSNFTGITT
jgi:hypothetical protein